MKAAIIPARGGSKRIPGKNIRDFCGQPIIKYSIDAAHQAGFFDRVIVSTDCDEIAEVAQECGAEAPFRRPKEISGDQVQMIPVIRHAIDWLRETGEQPDIVYCLFATAPFLSSVQLQSANDAFAQHPNADFVLAVTSFAYAPQRALRQTARGGLEFHWPDYSTVRSQDLCDTFHDAGLFFAGRADRFFEYETALAAHCLPLTVSRRFCQDIDTEEDWEIAESLYQRTQL